MLKKILHYFRINDWLDSKVPFMAGVLLFSLWFGKNNYPVNQQYLLFALYLLYVSMFLAFSYVINDFTDLEVDRAAGKQKVMLSLSKPLIIFSLAAMLVIGCVPLYFFVDNKIAYIFFTAFMYLCGAAYSVRWLFRFKERGFIGLLECSVAQKCLLIAASFISGFRYILIHQAIDLHNDKKTGVKTFVVEKDFNIRGWIIAALILEILLMAVIFFQICYTYPIVIIFIVAYFALERIIAIVVVKFMSVDLFVTYLAVPLESLYNVFFPIIMAVILAVNNIKALGIPIVIAALVAKCFMGKAAFVKVFFQTALKKEK